MKQQQPGPLPGGLPGLDVVLKWKKDARWDDIIRLRDEVLASLNVANLELASEVAFALTQAGRWDDARSLYEELVKIEPRRQFFSALAYVHYAALLAHKIRKPRLEHPERWRQGFERWMQEALRADPNSIKDRYRLAVYYASVLNGRDVPALRQFVHVIRAFESLPEEERTEQNRLFKTYVLALYGAARSAYRLKRFSEARRWIFRCIRVDEHRNHQRPLFKFFLAAKVLVAQRDHANAERALRLALQQEGPGDRDFVYALLAQIAMAEKRAEDALAWLEQHIPPQARKPYIWRLIGDAQLQRGNQKQALKAYKTSLLKDHVGRHLTLFRMGQIYESINELGQAKRCYEEAAEFRRRRYLTEDGRALEALARICERQGDRDGARASFQRMATLPHLAQKAQAELARLAG